MLVLASKKLGNSCIEKFKSIGLDVIFEEECTEEDLLHIDIWVTYLGFEKFDISKMKNLKYIHTTSTGFNQVPIDYVSDNNIILSNNKSGYSIPMAESIIMYILQIHKNSYKMFEQQRNKKWKLDMSWTELSGKRIGFVGTGNISKETAKRLKCFDVEIWGVNTDGREIENFDRCFSLDNSDKFFSECDIVIGIMPATEKTYKIINKEKFDLMKNGSIFMNIGRGNIVNQKDLINCIDKFKGVVLDVFEEEPLPVESELWDFDNVIITPHNSWVSDKNKLRLENTLYENLSEFVKKGKPKYQVVNLKKGY